MQNFWIPYSTRYVFWKFTNLLHILLRDMRLLLNVFLLRTAGLRPPIGEGGREPVGDDAYVLGFLPNKRLYTRLARFIFDPFFLKNQAGFRWFALIIIFKILSAVCLLWSWIHYLTLSRWWFYTFENWVGFYRVCNMKKG